MNTDDLVDNVSAKLKIDKQNLLIDCLKNQMKAQLEQVLALQNTVKSLETKLIKAEQRHLNEANINRLQSQTVQHQTKKLDTMKHELRRLLKKL